MAYCRHGHYPDHQRRGARHRRGHHRIPAHLLILFNQWFRFPSATFTKVFDIFIQSGAVLAVVIYFRKRIFPVYKTQTSQERQDIRSLWLKALVGFLPIIVLALTAYDFIEATLMIPIVVAIALAFWGLVIILVETRNNRALAAGKSPRYATVRDLTIPVVLAIGCLQCLGSIPGTSRSAATIIGALLLGASRVAAAEFSFFLSIPTLGGAGLYSLYKQLKGGMDFGAQELVTLATGTLVSFLVAWAVIAFLMKFIQKHDFRGFGWYRIALGLLLIGLIVAGIPLGV